MPKCCVLRTMRTVEATDGNFRLIVEWRTGGVPMTKKTKTKAQKKAEEETRKPRRGAR